MFLTKFLYLTFGFIFVLSAVSAGYAVTYATNSFGYSDNYDNVRIDLTRHVESYTDYPNYHYGYNYSYNYPNYGQYYYSGAYYYYPQPVYYAAPAYPVYTYTTYTVAQPVVYNAYSKGWYYN
jgi:hypothetical protein